MTDMDVAATARALGVSERTVRRWLKAGRLKGHRVGSRIRIPEPAIREVAEAYGQGQVGSPDPLVDYLFGPARQRERAQVAARDIDEIRRAHSRPAVGPGTSGDALLREARDERDRHWDDVVGHRRS